MSHSIRSGLLLALLTGSLVACSSGGGGSAPAGGEAAATQPDDPPVVDPPAAPSVIPDTPNVLLIIADDLGTDSMSLYAEGDQSPLTPRLDALAAQGLVFDNLWVNPVCSPTRAAIMSGKYAFRTNVFAPGDALDADELSVFDYLDTNAPAYGQALIGKWHLGGGMAGGGLPADFGIDHFDGILGGGVGDYYDWTRSDGVVGGPDTNYVTSVLVDNSIDWINQQDADTPWFLWLAFNAPHTPFHLPPADLHTQALSGDQADIDANPGNYYRAMIEAMDREIGRLLDSMPVEDRDDTVLFFIGDNGTPGQVSQAPFGMGRSKGSIYQGGIRTPMFAAGPGVRAGERESALINGTDFFATVAELAGVDVPAINDSISFADLLDTAGPGARQHVYSDDNDGASWTIRNERYKLIQYGDGTQELYDLDNDPFEETEMITAGADVAAILQSLEDQAALIRQ